MDISDTGAPLLMAVVNLTPDSFYSPSRAWKEDGQTEEEYISAVMARIEDLTAAGASIIDLGAISTRPGAAPVSQKEEWCRLGQVLKHISGQNRAYRISIDTTRSAIIRRAAKLVPDVIVNDISAGEDDPKMLSTAARLGLTFVAMHKRGTPQSMDSQCDYPDGVVPELIRYFQEFAARAGQAGLEDWILDPGLGFAKTPAQCWEILERLEELRVFGRPILIGSADKRFTREVPERVCRLFPSLSDGTAIADALAVKHGADILRVHRI